MTNIYVSSYDISDSSGSQGLPTESVMLAYDKVELKYTKQKEDGTADATVECGYDLKKNEVT